MKIAVMSSQQVQRVKKKSYTTNVTFFHLLMKASFFFDEMLVVCREDRIDKERKRFTIENKKLRINPYKGGVNNSYVSLLLESPIIFFKLLIIMHRNRRGIDIIWIPDIRVIGFVSVLVANILRIPFFLYIRGDNYQESVDRISTKPFLVRAIYSSSIKFEYLISKLLVKKAPTFICGSALLKNYKTPQKKIYKFISTLIDENDIEHDGKSILGKNTIKILFVGRIVKYKGLTYALKAIDLLLNTINTTTMNIELIVIGEGGDRIHAEKFVLENKLSNHIHFKGFINDKKKLSAIYNECDLLVVPSLTEGTPKIVPEAMAKGLPIIASNVGELPFMVEHNKNGYIVEPADSEAIAFSVAHLIAHPDLYANMSKESLIRAKEFTFTKQFKKMIGVIKQMVNETKDNR